MTKQQTHTPGPWRLDTNRRSVFGADGIVADVYGSMSADRMDREACKANARLIAAAPDLLAALANALDALEWHIEQDAEYSATRVEEQVGWESLERGRAAIARAEGKS